MKTIDLAKLPPEIVTELDAGETIEVRRGETIVAVILPGDPFAVIDRLRELGKGIAEEELIEQTLLAQRR